MSKICLLLFSLTFLSCQTHSNKDKLKAGRELLSTDRAFSAMSEKVGMKKAFLEYIDDNGVLLRPQHLPLEGANAIDFLSTIVDTSFTLTWSPQHADIAASQDLGYTYGVYTLSSAKGEKKGTYVSIWKKQADGKWRFVLDTGNPGIARDTAK
jgi:ketosteroid isomerase-like protein